MKRKLLYGLISTTLSLSASTVVSDDSPYYKLEDKSSNVEIIYPKEHQRIAKQSLLKEASLHQTYQKLYNWKLDEKLYVGLISSNNQIANGFSTQYPNNRQINYIGGTQLIDKFSTISWLDTLLYHEGAHNYQTNIKANRFSQLLHSVLGNGSFLFTIPFITPNVTISSFLLEGNAVLHESLFENGGRLYNGLYKAQTILQAKAGNLNAQNLFNETITYPYGDKFYGVGGFFQLFLAQKYGIKNLNSYFSYHSNAWWFPFFTNWPMRDAIGVDFEDAVEDFSQEFKAKAKDFVMVEGDSLGLTSEFFYPLSSDSEEIFFMLSKDARSKPTLVTLDKKSIHIREYEKDFLASKVIKEKQNYYTQASSYTSATKITQGLYDENRNLKEGSGSKMVQGYLSDGSEVYFDVKKSFEQPQLYVEGEFYAQVNSSVYIDQEDNLYYFKQDKKSRTLYKNKTPLYSYKGFYGKVSDVAQDGSIYFIANSTLGSTLYKYTNAKVQRVSDADNIADAKLLKNEKILFCALGEKNYYYTIAKEKQIDVSPYETTLFFEDDAELKFTPQKVSAKEIKPYNSFLDMHYSGTDVEAYNGVNGFSGKVQLNLADPLTQNSFSTFLQRDDDTTVVGGATYANTLSSYHYALSLYAILDKDETISSAKRDFGVNIALEKVLYRKSSDSVVLSTNYMQDYYEKRRAPLTLELNLATQRRYAYSFYTNYLNALDLFVQREREDNLVGVSYSFEHDFYKESYFGFYVGGISTLNYINATTAKDDVRGVKITSIADEDRATLSITNLAQDYYVNNASYMKLSLKKVFNLSSYWFTFPLSLQREALYVSHTHYQLNSFSKSQEKVAIDNTKVGVTFATLFLNKLVLPLSVEYTHSKASKDVLQESDSVGVRLELEY